MEAPAADVERAMEAAEASVPARREVPDPRDLLPGLEPERRVTDWGRSERVEGFLDRTVIEFLYRYWFRVEVEGTEHVPARRRRPARVQPRRRPAARRADDRQGDPRGAPPPAPGPPDGGALLQGLPRVCDARAQGRRGRRAPGKRPPAAVRRAPARPRVPRRAQGQREALQGALPAAPLRPRRLRRGGDARRRADRAGRGGRGGGGGADLRPREPPAAADRPALLPDHSDVPAFRGRGHAGLSARQVHDPLPRADPHRRLGRAPVARRGLVQTSPPRSAPRSRRTCSTCSASGRASGSAER